MNRREALHIGNYFNSSLDDDENYVLAINQKIPEWLGEFKEVIDKRVLWDLIKYCVRQIYNA